jgi:thiol-disulfide isomerase/thioredoxin
MIVVLDEWSSFVTMKKLLLISVTSFTLLSAQAQSLNAPNFTELDIDGNIHNLYTDYLNQGKAVYIDLSATWCGPCIEIHSRGYFNELYDLHGPDGYNDGHVFLVESDPSTPVSALYGPNGNYNWVEESNYPVIDDADASIYNDYDAFGYPTICLVCPDKSYYVEDEADLYWTDIVSSEYLEDKMYEKCGNSISPQNDVDIALLRISSLSTYCGEQYYPKAIVRNMGSETVTNIDFEVVVNDNLASTYSWSGSLSTFEKTEVIIPNIEGAGTDMNVEVTVISVNNQVDDLLWNNTLNKTVDLGYYSLASNEVNIVAHIDQMGWQCEWQFTDPEDNIIGQVTYYPTGNLDDPLPLPVEYTFSNLDPGCYTFHAYDATANGLVDFSLTEWGSGTDTTIYYPTPGFVFTDINGIHMASLQTFDYFNDFSILVGAEFTGGYVSPIREEAGVVEMLVYPNPANSEVYIQSDLLGEGRLDLFNLLGESVPVQMTAIAQTVSKMNVSHLNKGVYLIRISSGDSSKSSTILVE